MGAIYDRTMSGDMTALLYGALKRHAKMFDLSEDDLEDARREFAPLRRYKCNDGRCGALDCARCHPENKDGDEDEKDEN